MRAASRLTLIALLSFEDRFKHNARSQLLDYCKEKKEERLQQEEEASKAHKQEGKQPGRARENRGRFPLCESGWPEFHITKCAGRIHSLCILFFNNRIKTKALLLPNRAFVFSFMHFSSLSTPKNRRPS